MFEQSSTDMHKRFYPILLTLNCNRGISDCPLQRVIYTTARQRFRFVRTAMGNVKTRETFEGLI
jgi:hypothetical protein